MAIIHDLSTILLKYSITFNIYTHLVGLLKFESISVTYNKMALNLNFRGMGSEEHKSAFEESQAAAGDSLTLLLELPDGRVLEESVSNIQFKQGNDIDWVIFQVSRKTEIDQQSIVNLT